MNILAVGDIVGDAGSAFLSNHLPSVKRLYGIDFTIVNGENSAKGNGIGVENAKSIFSAGADVITTGNHVWQKKEIFDFLDENANIIRPENYPKGVPGRGYTIIDCGKYSVCVINLLGNIYLEPVDSPFEAADRVLNEIEGKAKIIVVDMHAEATSEKKAMGYYLDGRVSAVFGTHTHVQTADEQILSKGTAYITDIGMTGAIDSIIGVKTDIILKKFLTRLPVYFEQADGDCMMNAVIISVDEKTGISQGIERITIKS